MAAAVSDARLQKDLETREAENADLYEKLIDRDGSIEVLEKDLRTAREQLEKLQQEFGNQVAETKSIVQTLSELRNELYTSNEDRDQLKILHQSERTHGKELEQAAFRLEADLVAKRKEFNKIKEQYDDERTLNHNLHVEIDRLEQEQVEHANAAEDIHTAQEYLQAIKDSFEDVFTDLELELIPENFVKLKRGLDQHPVLQRTHSERNLQVRGASRPDSLRHRQLSIGDELEGFKSEEDDSSEGSIEAKPGTNGDNKLVRRAKSHVRNMNGSKDSITFDVPGRRTSSIRSNGGGSDKQLREANERIALLELEKKRLESRVSDAENATIAQKKALAEQAAGLDKERAALDARKAELSKAGESQAALKARIQLLELQVSRPRGKTDTNSAKSAETEQLVADKAALKADLIAAQKEMDEYKRSIRSQRETITKLERQTIRAKEADRLSGAQPASFQVTDIQSAVSHLLIRVPWWINLIYAVMLLTWLSLTVAAYRERSLWLAANDQTYSYLRLIEQANGGGGGLLNFGIRQWIEDMLGIERELLG